MENTSLEKRTALTILYKKAKETHVDIIEGGVLLAFHPSLEVFVKKYEEGDYSGVLTLLSMFYRNPPSTDDVLNDKISLYTEENSGLTSDICELATALFGRPVDWNDPLVLHRVLTSDYFVMSTPELFDKLTEIIQNRTEQDVRRWTSMYSLSE